MNEPLSFNELIIIFRIIVAAAMGRPVSDPQVLGDIREPNTWRDWIQLHGAQAAAMRLRFLADAAFQSAVEEIADAHARAAVVAVGPPTSTQHADMLDRLNTLNHFIQNDQTFHAALNIMESLANAAAANAT